MKVAVLVSVGVDSSLALHLLREQGHEVTAFYLKIWLEEELSFLGECPWEEDLSYVQQLCVRYDIPLKIVSLQKEYWNIVVSYLIEQVSTGKTPNPDMLCNQRIKFGAFFDKIDDSYEKVATGHYAQVVEENGCYLLRVTPDAVKDQTYFLAHLSQGQLSRALFPIGHLTKVQVRELAQKYDIPSKNRKDSQGICFLGQVQFKDFLKHHLGVRFGDIVEFETGKKLGEHEGFWYYTIGQRKGLGLSGGPWYVVSKDHSSNIVYVSNQYFSPDKKRNQFTIAQCHWIAGTPPSQNRLFVKIRHGQERYPSFLTICGNEGLVTIDGQDQGIAPGQFAVFYDADSCLGCGVIR